jgi:hypothetical protein
MKGLGDSRAVEAELCQDRPADKNIPEVGGSSPVYITRRSPKRSKKTSSGSWSLLAGT